MNRRGFLLGAGGILATMAAPAIVRADSLMKVVPRDLRLFTPDREYYEGLDLAVPRGERAIISLLIQGVNGLQLITQDVVMPVDMLPGDTITVAKLPAGTIVRQVQVAGFDPLFEAGVSSVRIEGGIDGMGWKDGESIRVRIRS